MSDPSPHDFSSVSHAEQRRGVAFGLTAYGCWGFFPLFFKQLSHVSPLQVLAHRICWSLAVLVVVLTGCGVWSKLGAVVKRKRTLLLLSATTLLISTNWFVFILAVDHRQVLQSSFGYFINPLVSVLLGVVFLHERLRILQLFSLFLAVAGVAILTIIQGELPWTALILAFSFGLYGLLRKIADVDALMGLFVETLMLVPVAAGYLILQALNGSGSFAVGPVGTSVLLAASGPVTVVPLVLFAASVRRLRLATVGFLQYITPTLHFVLAVSAFGEKVGTLHLLSFACIWTGLLLYTWDATRRRPAAG